jgi:ribosome-associated toxin RatA of RatAB toxin-antitoxin module
VDRGVRRDGKTIVSGKEDALMALFRCALLGLPLVLVGCGESGVDWSKPENFVLREKSTKKDEAVQLDYWSLVDAPCQPVYDALADIEHYPDFIPGVDRTQLLTVDGNTKTIQIAQRVIGRQSNAKVKWTFNPEKKHIDFTTLASDLNYNDGHYELEPSPDGKRCLVRSTFLVKQGQGMAQAVPIGVLAAGTREAFLAAAQGVKKRATAGAG